METLKKLEIQESALKSVYADLLYIDNQLKDKYDRYCLFNSDEGFLFYSLKRDIIMDFMFIIESKINANIIAMEGLKKCK